MQDRHPSRHVHAFTLFCSHGSLLTTQDHSQAIIHRRKQKKNGYIPTIIRILLRCSCEPVLDLMAVVKKKTALPRLCELRDVAKNVAPRQHICLTRKEAKQKYTPSSYTCPTSAQKTMTMVVLPSELRKRAVLGQQTGQGAQAAAGHLVHRVLVLLR